MRFLISVVMTLMSLYVLGQSDVVINEFMASNSTFIADEAGEFDDWIEIRNNTTEWISLKNYHLSDTLDILDKWKFPDDAALEPHGYLIVWADEDGNQGDYHANFKLDADGEELYLIDKTGTIIDQLEFGLIPTDISYARIPNGTGSFTNTNPTFGFNNDNTSSTDRLSISDVLLYPNPISDVLFIEGDIEGKEVQIINGLGVVISSKSANGKSLQIDVSSLPSGLYFVTLDQQFKTKLYKD